MWGITAGVVLCIFYVVADIISNYFSYDPYIANMDDVKALKEIYGKNIRIGYFTNEKSGKKIWYSLFNKYKIPSWSDNITFYCHGNTGWIGYNVDFSFVDEFSKHSTVLVFDYRGFGLSEGATREKGMKQDALEMWKFLLTKHPDVNTITPLGYSLGTSIVSHTMGQLKKDNYQLPERLVLISPFYNSRMISQDIFPGVGIFNTNSYKTNKYLLDLNGEMKITYIHSSEDELISMKHVEKLNKDIPGDVYVIKGVHNNPQLTGECSNFIGSCF